MAKLNIKNYTSTVTSSKSRAHIEDMLMKLEVLNINKEIREGVCVGITFLYADPILNQTVAFKLKPNTQKCFDVFWAERKQKTAEARKTVMDQADRTAWKILSDIVDLQVTAILLDQATALQMFLPYIYDPTEDQTLYEKVISGKTKLLTSTSR